MFDAIKGKLSAVEGKLRAVIGQARGDVEAAEGKVHQMGVGIPAPLDKTEATVKQADAGVVQSITPVRQRVVTMAPPGG